MDLLKLSALEIGGLIRQGELGVVEATRFALDRIDKTNPAINSFVTITGEQAIARAEAVQKDISAGQLTSPLAGVPMAVKDNISTQGIRTTCGSKMLDDYIPAYDATVAERIFQNGAVVLGKTNMDEFAMGSTTETSYSGPTKNPWATDRVPGGSSGGSAAAVAAGQAWYALGSDTGGSIRQPCAYCGLTGLKPTYGAVSRYGLIAYASSLDQIGPIARTAADCAAALQTFAGPDSRDSSCMPEGQNLDIRRVLETVDNPASVKGLVIGLPEDYFTHGLQPEIDQAIRRAARVLEDQGAIIRPISLSLVDEAIPAYYLIATAEASSNLSRYDGIKYGWRTNEEEVEDLVDFYRKGRTEGFGREVRRRILLGTFALSSGYYDAYYLKALKARQMVKDSFAKALGDCDMLLAPVAPTTAPKIGESLSDPLKMYLSDIYTVSANLAGLPALSLPCGLDDQGLPIGMQLIGPAFGDAKLLAVGAAYQVLTDFHQLRPEIEEVAK